MKHLMRAFCAGLVALVAACAGSTAYTPTGKIEVLWLGQAGFRITTVTGKVIVIDPWVRTNPKTPAQYKNLDALGKVDLILVTHAHFDHFADAPDLAKKNNAPMYGPAGLGTTVATLGILPANLAPRFGKGGTIMPFGPQGVKITATHAEHSSELVWKNPATGKDETHPGGEPVGYVIELENGFKIYHMGDTGIFGDLRLIGRYYRPDLLLMPIGRHFVMSPEDAAYVTENYLKPSFVIPMHYGTIPVLSGKPEEYIKALGNTSVKVYPIQPGEKVMF
jgi:L-ascorbate metabolism protein UlaG (beta-lactamase superfamily)